MNIVVDLTDEISAFDDADGIHFWMLYLTEHFDVPIPSIFILRMYVFNDHCSNCFTHL